MNWKASMNGHAQRTLARAHGVSRRWTTTSSASADQRQQHRQHPGGDQLRLEAGLDGVEDRLAQPADADEGRDVARLIDRHRRDPDARR